MPILDRSYISNFYLFKPIDELDRILVLDTFSESEVQQSVNPTRLIQGDIGIHVINVGGSQWEAELSAPVLISPNANVVNILEMFAKGYNNENFQISPNYSTVSTIMTFGSLKLDSSNITCHISCLSDTGSITSWLIPSLISDKYTTSIIGRTARFYDTYMVIQHWSGDIGLSTTNYHVIEAEIKVEVIHKDYYLIRNESYNRQNKVFPEFLVEGYVVSGSITIAYPVDDSPSVNRIESLSQHTQGHNMLIYVAGYILDLSKGQLVISKISKEVRTNTLTTATIEFQSTSTR
jgi:hypothetical protein